MAHPHYNHQQYPPPQQQQQQPQHGQHPPPVQTQNLNHYQPQRPFSPPSYQQSPTAMSPNMGHGIPPAKRQRLSPNPPSPAPPYQSPFATSPYPQSQPHSPYATSPQYPPGMLSVPGSPATQQPPPFHQPQPYQHPNGVPQQPPPPSSMPPPKTPASRAQDNSELEKPTGRETDVNNISDVLSGGIVDLRAEEDLLLHSSSNRNYGASFNSQGTGSTATPNTSFNNWSQQGSHGAFQGTGPLQQNVTQEQHEAEFIRKHEQAARILNESAQHPLTDPFLEGNVLRHRMAKRAYDAGIQVNVDGLFDKIPEKTPRDSTRTVQAGANGEQIIGLEAASLLNQNAPLVEIISLLSLAAEDRIRTLVEDAFALSQGRQHTSHGVIPPQLVDIAVVEKDAEQKMVAPVNILRTPWEAPDSTGSPPSTAMKQPPNAARLPTPPSEAPPTPQRTFQNVNHVANALKRKVAEDEKYEKERLRKRQKRQQGSAATPTETPAVLLPPPEKMTKKDKDALKKQNSTGDVLHRKANETASMALGLGKKNKYSWMTGGGGAGGSGASTPRANPAAGRSGAATPAAPTVEKGLSGRKRTFGTDIENTEIGARIQVRDLVHVLEHDGREKKTLALMLARLKNTEKDEKKADFDRKLPAAAGR
ncbi:transcription initiation factor TFIID component TAF4 family-domain-containing protein [Paraphoma chrysanthemicola]|nr:transcription initiation factor TFIID component TAF4 family-domain-containing protein [Paraphoma chrysanthemicola]